MKTLCEKNRTTMNKINILGIEYTVKHVDVGDTEYPFAGRCIPDDQLIVIRTGMQPDYTEQVLIHEIIHALLWQLGEKERFNDEEFTDRLAMGLRLTFPNLLKGGRK